MSRKRHHTEIVEPNDDFEFELAENNRAREQENDPKKANGLGRPTKYFPEYPQMLIDHMNRGYSYETFAAVVTVSVKTLYNWEVEHPDFLQAKEVGTPKGQFFWEGIGLMGINGKIEYFPSAVYIFTMKNRFGWRDNPEEKNNDKQADWSHKMNIAMKEFEEGVESGIYPTLLPAPLNVQNKAQEYREKKKAEKAEARKSRPDGDPRKKGEKAKRELKKIMDMNIKKSDEPE